jgi:predicted secreted protein
MKMRSKFAVAVAVTVLVFSGFVLAGCGGGGSAGHRDPSQPIVVEKGSEFTIMLPSEPEAGYAWRLAEPLEEEVVTLVKREFREAEGEKPGEERWTFKAQGLGVTHITFAYGKVWAREEAKAGEREGAGKERKESSPKAPETGEVQAPGHQDFVKAAASRQEETPAEPSGPLAEEAEETRVTFTVDVRKKGSTGKEPKKFEDPSEEISVERGHKFSVALELKPAEGLAWRLAEPLPAQLRLLEVEYEEKEKAHGEGHSVGEETWVFDPVEAGEVELRFRLEDASGRVKEEKAFRVKVEKEEKSSSGGH